MISNQQAVGQTSSYRETGDESATDPYLGREGKTTLSVVVPCFNEERTLEPCIEALLDIESDELQLEVLIVNDASIDNSRIIANRLSDLHPVIKVLHHEKNAGKGAALRTGFQAATGDFVAIQDADLEYDPKDLRELLRPLEADIADVVLGSRFVTTHARRVLHYWHSLGNRFLTLLSNMFTDMNLTDMETCYKVFRRDIIQSVKIEEDRFGFEPEIVAKIADLRCRVYEMGISYRGRTYEEGKKIGVKDGFRALYCIVRYNAHRAPLPIQFLFYLPIGAAAAIVNMIVFLIAFRVGVPAVPAALTAFIVAALANYVLCVRTIFQPRAHWNRPTELGVYAAVVLSVAAIDSGVTVTMLRVGVADWLAKACATLVALIANFLGRRFLVFPEPKRQPWKTSDIESSLKQRR
jgi:glycosyltransferase involved in cell wall biosynthesis